MVVLCDLSGVYVLRVTCTFENLKKMMIFLSRKMHIHRYMWHFYVRFLDVLRALLANSGPRFSSSPHGALLCT